MAVVGWDQYFAKNKHNMGQLHPKEVPATPDAADNAILSKMRDCNPHFTCLMTGDKKFADKAVKLGSYTVTSDPRTVYFNVKVAEQTLPHLMPMLYKLLTVPQSKPPEARRASDW